MAEKNEIEDLFGSDSEDNDASDYKSSSIRNTTLELSDNENDFDKSYIEPPINISKPIEISTAIKAVGTPLNFTENKDLNIDKDTKFSLLRLPQVLAVDIHPFQPENHEEHDTSVFPRNVLRWKESEDKSISSTNTRLVEWSDGSKQLLVGSQPFNILEQDINSNLQLYYDIRKDIDSEDNILLQGQKLNSRIFIQPSVETFDDQQRLKTKLLDRLKEASSINIQRTTLVGDIKDKKTLKEEHKDREKQRQKELKLKQKYQKVNPSRFGTDFLEAGLVDNSQFLRKQQTQENTDRLLKAKIDPEFGQKKRKLQ